MTRAVRGALRVVRAEGCICRPKEARHQVLLALLELLERRRMAPWSEVLEQASNNARALNRQLGLTITSRPAAAIYTAKAMRIGWFQGFIAHGNAEDGRRYAENGPVVSTEVAHGQAGPQLRLTGDVGLALGRRSPAGSVPEQRAETDPRPAQPGVTFIFHGPLPRPVGGLVPMQKIAPDFSFLAGLTTFYLVHDAEHGEDEFDGLRARASVLAGEYFAALQLVAPGIRPWTRLAGWIEASRTDFSKLIVGETGSPGAQQPLDPPDVARAAEIVGKVQPSPFLRRALDLLARGLASPDDATYYLKHAYENLRDDVAKGQRGTQREAGAVAILGMAAKDLDRLLPPRARHGGVGYRPPGEANLEEARRLCLQAFFKALDHITETRAKRA